MAKIKTRETALREEIDRYINEMFGGRYQKGSEEYIMLDKTARHFAGYATALEQHSVEGYLAKSIGEYIANHPYEQALIGDKDFEVRHTMPYSCGDENEANEIAVYTNYKLGQKVKVIIVKE